MSAGTERRRSKERTVLEYARRPGRGGESCIFLYLPRRGKKWPSHGRGGLKRKKTGLESLRRGGVLKGKGGRVGSTRRNLLIWRCEVLSIKEGLSRRGLRHDGILTERRCLLTEDDLLRRKKKTS